MFVLTDFERLALLCGCTGLLGLVLIITTCFVCPSCWLNKKLMRRQRREENKMLFLRNSYQLDLMKEPPPPYDPTTRSVFLDMRPSEVNRRLASVNSFSSGCSDTESVAGIPFPILSDREVQALEIVESPPYERGNVSITIQFKKVLGEDKKVYPQLRVDLKEASELQMRLYGGRCNPYFVIGLYEVRSFMKKKRRKSKPVPFHEFHSTVVKKSQNPLYNESFFFPMGNKNLKKCVLKIEARDQDKLVNDTVLGEASFGLRDAVAFLSLEPSKELDVNLKLEDSKFIFHFQINGQLLLGLCYLPTAERMTIAVLRANNLKGLSENQDGVDLYVQAMAIYGGKIFERRKTSCRPSSGSPVFNEMLMFDVPYSKLDNIVLLIAIYSRAKQTSCSDDETGKKRSHKDLCMGKVAIGSSGRKNTQNHWNAMRNSPRRQIVQWHELR